MIDLFFFVLFLFQTRLPVYIAHTPAGTSTRNMVHFAQVRLFRRKCLCSKNINACKKPDKQLEQHASNKLVHSKRFIILTPTGQFVMTLEGKYLLISDTVEEIEENY